MLLIYDISGLISYLYMIIIWGLPTLNRALETPDEHLSGTTGAGKCPNSEDEGNDKGIEDCQTKQPETK